jgi:hypothetical protein
MKGGGERGGGGVHRADDVVLLEHVDDLDLVRARIRVTARHGTDRAGRGPHRWG